VLILPRQAGRVSVFWLAMGSEVLGWDALGAVEKYGPQEWSGWEFRAEPVPKSSGADVVRFAWREVTLVRLQRPGDAGGGKRRPPELTVAAARPG
jgi:hypothetical protein